MMLARVLFCAIAVLTIGAISPPAPVSGESKPVEKFVQAKKPAAAKLSPAHKAMLRKHLASAKVSDRKVVAALKDARRVKGPYGGHRDKAIHSLRVAHKDLQTLQAHIKHTLK
jgi:hypothetical protein